MNNPFEYQNDPSTLSQDFAGVNQLYQNKVGEMANKAIGERAADLMKAGIDTTKEYGRIKDAIDEGIAAAAGPGLVQNVIRPAVEAVGEKGGQAIDFLQGISSLNIFANILLSS